MASSDGSTFVTKAEFDKALSNFNERLTAFEAGINSKIDSQVTSYLDRNGIWSAGSNIDEFTKIIGHFANTAVEGKIGIKVDSIKVY